MQLFVWLLCNWRWCYVYTVYMDTKPSLTVLLASMLKLHQNIIAFSCRFQLLWPEMKQCVGKYSFFCLEHSSFLRPCRYVHFWKYDACLLIVSILLNLKALPIWYHPNLKFRRTITEEQLFWSDSVQLKWCKCNQTWLVGLEKIKEDLARKNFLPDFVTDMGNVDAIKKEI